MRRSLLVWSLLLVFYCAGLPALGQAPPQQVYEPFVSTPEYDDAWRYLGFRTEEFLVRLAAIAARNPGKTLGAVCLLQQARYTESREEAKALYNAVIAGYPRSRFEIAARLSLLSPSFGNTDFDAQLAAVDRLAQSYGGPALAAILGGQNRDRLSAQVLALPLEFQYGLDSVYFDMLGSIGLEKERYRQVIPLALFHQQTFSLRGDGNTLAVYFLVLAQGKNWNSVLYNNLANPTVRVKRPKDGRSIGPRPKIRIELNSGDFTYSKIDIQQSKFLLDGQDLKPVLRMRLKTLENLTPGKPFQRILLSGRPAQALSRGRHTLEIVARVSQYRGTGLGLTRTLVNFTVGKSQDDDCDRRDDDDRDWDEDD